MVFAAWLLLSLLACKAQDIGVQLPLRGPQAISQEDLKRDLWLRMQSKTAAIFQQKIGARFSAMGLQAYQRADFCTPQRKRCCMAFQGQGKKILVEVVDAGTLAGMVATTALISVAKSFDGSPRNRLFCIHQSPTGLQQGGWVIGDLTGATLQVDEQSQRFLSYQVRKKPEDIDFRLLEDHVRALSKRLHH